MKYDNDYLKTLYDSNDLASFLSAVNVEEIVDLRKRAIIGALQRSIRVLHLEFNPIPLPEQSKKLKSQV